MHLYALLSSKSVETEYSDGLKIGADDETDVQAIGTIADPAACEKKVEATYQKCLETKSTKALCKAAKEVELKTCRKSQRSS